MIKENQRFLNGVLVLIDTLVILFSLFLAYHCCFIISLASTSHLETSLLFFPELQKSSDPRLWLLSCLLRSCLS